MPGGQGSPVVTQTWKHEIASSSVEVTFTAFADMNMLVFTDTGSMGTILRASVDGGPQESTTYTIQTLLGRRDDELQELVARNLIHLSRSSSCTKYGPVERDFRPLLLSLGIKHFSMETTRGIVAFAKEHIDWKRGGE